MEINSNIHNNAVTIDKELQWLSAIIETRMKLYFGTETDYNAIEEIPVPDLSNDPSMYADLVRTLRIGTAERILLILALAPHVQPQVLDMFFIKNSNYDRGFTEFGGLKGAQHSGFLPTGETYSFLLAGSDLARRFTLTEFFSRKHYFYEQNILKLNSTVQDEPLLSASLQLSQEYLVLLTQGTQYRPDYTTQFPAKLITTHLEWSDLVLPHSVLSEIQEIHEWLKHSRYLMQDMGLQKHLKRGYRCLFYGPPGTGKTLTAALLGKVSELDVYRIDLSMIVSKYIGETEKNLGQLFDLAENKSWILFFDEADSLFGKRTQTKDSNDRHANQEVSYLLQRIEDFPGVVILASNLKGNIDDAFARRFQSMIHFPQPGVTEKLRLWKSVFNNGFSVGKDVDFEELAHEYNLSGGMMVNVLRHAALRASSRSEQVIHLTDIKEGVSRELRKEGKSI